MHLVRDSLKVPNDVYPTKKLEDSPKQDFCYQLDVGHTSFMHSVLCLLVFKFNYILVVAMKSAFLLYILQYFFCLKLKNVA